MRTIQGFLLGFLLANGLRAEVPVKQVLTLGVAKKIAAAAEAEALKRGSTVVIVVVDDGGHVIVLERLDDTAGGQRRGRHWEGSDGRYFSKAEQGF